MSREPGERHDTGIARDRAAGMSGGGPSSGAAHRRLEDTLSYTFSTQTLLEEALSHSSISGGHGRTPASNERLEFLGDRVLGLAVAQLLYERFPGDSVGALARRYTALVRRGALHEIAIRIGLPALVKLSKGEEDAGGRDNPSLIADCCEAVLGAIYLDGGYDAAASVIRRHWNPLVDDLGGKPPLDSKTALQEWMQGRGMALPIYREAGRSGPDHAPTFAVAVEAQGRPPVTARGPTKRSAEQAAAALLLSQLKDNANEH